MKRQLILGTALAVAVTVIFLILNRGFFRTKPFSIPPAGKSTSPPQGQRNTGAGVVSEETPMVMIEVEFPIKDRKTKEVAYKIKAEEASVYEGGKVVLDEPRIIIYGKDGEETVVKGKRGELDRTPEKSEGDQWQIRSCWMKGDIGIKSSDGLTALMDELRWRSESEKFYTQSPVKIESRNFLITGKGMEALDKMNRIVVEKDVNVVLKPGKGFALFGGSGGPPEEEASPVTVTCDGTLEFLRDRNEAVFTKNVISRQDDTTVRSEIMRIFFRKTPEGMEIERIEAEGNITAENPDQEAVGKRLTYNADDKQAKLFGSPARIWQGENFVESEMLSYDTSQRLWTEKPGHLKMPSGEGEELEVTWQGSMHYDPEKKCAIFEKDVVAKQGLSTISSQYLEVFIKKSKGMQGEKEERTSIERLRAQNEVRIVEADRRVKGDEFVYDRNNDTTAVGAKRGEAEVIRGTDVLRGERISFDQERDILVCRGKGYLKIVPKEGGPEGQEDKGVIEIWWSDGMTMENKSDRAHFEGEVRVKQEEATIEADRLEVLFADEKGTRGIREVKAFGNVHTLDVKRETWSSQMIHRPGELSDFHGEPARVKQGTETLSAERLVFQEKEEAVDAFGPGELIIEEKPASPSEKPRRTTAKWKEKMFYRGREHKAELFGDVDVVQEEVRLLSQHLVAYFDEKGPRRIRKAVATGKKNGDVIFMSGANRGEGTHLVWNASRGVAVLTGSPLATLLEGKNRTRAKKVTFETEGNRVTAEQQWSMYYEPETLGLPAETSEKP